MSKENEKEKEFKRRNASRVIPASIEAEEAILGSLMLDKEASYLVFGDKDISKDDFYATKNAILFDVCEKLHQQTKPIDFITVSGALAAHEEGYQIDVEYLTNIIDRVPTTANLKSYIDIVKNDSLKRSLIKAGQEIVDEGFFKAEGTEALESAEKKVFDLAKKRDNSSLVNLVNEAGLVIEKIEKMSRDKDAFVGIKTGFEKLDEVTNGLQNSDLIILAARPGFGKTSFAMNLIVNAALNEDKNAAVFSLEMPKQQLIERVLSGVSYVPLKNIKTAKMTKDEWLLFTEAKNKFAEKTKKGMIFIDDSSLNTPMSILSKCRRMQRDKGLDIVMIDYLQLMRPDGSTRKDDNRQQEISDISRNLKILARELNVPVIVLSQLSRTVESRKEHRPQLSDLRDSGAIEQDADIVMFIDKPSMYKDNQIAEGAENNCQVIIAKHRNGELADIDVKWVGEIVSFVDIKTSVKLTTSGAKVMPKRGKSGLKMDEYLTDKDAPIDTSFMHAPPPPPDIF